MNFSSDLQMSPDGVCFFLRSNILETPSNASYEESDEVRFLETEVCIEVKTDDRSIKLSFPSRTITLKVRYGICNAYFHWMVK